MPMDVSLFKGKSFMITMAGTDQCLTVEGDRIVLLPWGGWGRPEDQQWELVDAGGGRVRIRSTANKRVLDELDAENPLDLRLMPESDAPSQFWAVQKAGGDGAYQILSTQSGLALSLSPLRIYPPHVAQWTSRIGDPGQQWLFQEA